MNTCYGATLNARAGAAVEAEFTRAEEIGQLVEVFCDTGFITIGDTAYYLKDDFYEFLFGRAEYNDWSTRAHAPGLTDTQRTELVAELEAITDRMLREYVEILDEKITAYLEDIAA